MWDGSFDTAKLESWPLLRPDELGTLPTEVLKASVLELEVMCGQDADGSGEKDLNESLSPQDYEVSSFGFAL